MMGSTADWVQSGIDEQVKAWSASVPGLSNESSEIIEQRERNKAMIYPGPSTSADDIQKALEKFRDPPTYPWPPPTKTPHKCPCCDGWGTRRKQLNGVLPGHKKKSWHSADVPCPSCEGKGVIFT